jgi:hypothetical protein
MLGVPVSDTERVVALSNDLLTFLSSDPPHLVCYATPDLDDLPRCLISLFVSSPSVLKLQVSNVLWSYARLGRQPEDAQVMRALLGALFYNMQVTT